MALVEGAPWSVRRTNVAGKHGQPTSSIGLLRFQPFGHSPIVDELGVEFGGMSKGVCGVMRSIDTVVRDCQIVPPAALHTARMDGALEQIDRRMVVFTLKCFVRLLGQLMPRGTSEVDERTSKGTNGRDGGNQQY